ncbi:methyltransferase domain-containing protein [Alcaligenaceae bacterium CGII-47]|nr:methyltransferase domain-containing protein [Alcaligenaceae bacterium CGII-47]
MFETNYQTKLKNIVIRNVDNMIMRTLLDREQYYDPDGEAMRLGISSALWPLFGLLWPSSIYLSAHLALRPVCPKEMILEIGCGLGLASLVAHRRGAQMTASDYHPLAETFLRENLRLNHLPPSLKYRHGQWGLSIPLTDEQAGRTVLSERYDLVVGSDLLYERDTPPALAKFIDQHTLPDAEVWIVDANRGYRPAFNRHMAEYRFDLIDDMSLNQTPDQHGTPAYRGRLLKYRRSGATSLPAETPDVVTLHQ